MSDKPTSNSRTYEIRLVTSQGKSMLFAIEASTIQAAVEHAKGLMLRHQCDSGEVWCGLQLIRQL